MQATSSGRAPLLKRYGMSERKMGTKSARPWFTAWRTLAPMNSARCRRCPSMSRATCGAGPSACMCTISTFSSVWARATNALSKTAGVAAAPCKNTRSPDRTCWTASSADTNAVIAGQSSQLAAFDLLQVVARTALERTRQRVECKELELRDLAGIEPELAAHIPGLKCNADVVHLVTRGVRVEERRPRVDL